MTTLLDAHTHSIASGHAFSSLQEMARAAADKGLQLLGITEHAPALPGTCHPLYFRNLHVVPRNMYGVRLLLGAELNILDTQGNLDLDADFCRKYLDIRIAGMHYQCWKGGTKEENTRGLLAVIRNPIVHIISHPGDGTAELDCDPLGRASKEFHTLLYIKASSRDPFRGKDEAKRNNIEILLLAKKHSVPIILGSDAHVSFRIADYTNALPLLEETRFPEELVVNDKPDFFLRYTGIAP